MQTTNTIKELLPSTMKLTNTEWRIILTHGEHTRFGKGCAPITFVSGVLGYARRNNFQSDYIQVCVPTTKGSIGSWHIHETEAEILITVARPAPKQNAAQRGWEAGWMSSF
jgi:carbamate kinase